MASQNTGSVRFVGDPGTNCREAQEYREEDKRGNPLEPNEVLSGIPEDLLEGFLLNADFEADDSTAEGVYEDRVVTAARVDSAPDGQPAISDKPLDDQNKEEIAQTARAVGVEVTDDMNKDEILDAVKASEQPSSREG